MSDPWTAELYEDQPGHYPIKGRLDGLINHQGAALRDAVTHLLGPESLALADESTNGVDAVCRDSSELSYDNRQSAIGIVRVLWVAEDERWGSALRDSLPAGGEGTLQGRLASVDVRAKTGTLDQASSLSGWVRSQVSGQWLEFSPLTTGMDEYKAKTYEDQIVKVLATSASDPTP